jgi:hypothetical protein
MKVPDASHLVSFDQDDSFGQSGYDGLVAAYQAIKGGFNPPPTDPTTPIERIRYTRDDPTSVPGAVSAASAYLGKLLAADDANHTVGILMTDTYGPAADFITQLRQWQYANDAEQSATHKATRLKLWLVNVSFVGPNTLAERLASAGMVQTPMGPLPYTDGVVLSQVVPNYQSDDSDVVHAYLDAIAASGDKPGFTSLEGYLSTRVFLAGLEAHQGPLTPEALISTFESLPVLDLGLGATAGFGPDDHDYSKSVWGTTLDASGAFQDRYFWTEGTSLQLSE